MTTLVTRVKAILMTPNVEWPIIAAESADLVGLYKNYVLPLAAIGPVCGLIGSSSAFHRIGLSAGASLRIYLTMYVSTLVGVYIFGFIIAKLAPRFGAAEDTMGGVKVAAYSATASWVGGVFNLIPLLHIVAVLFAFYSLYLFYLGLPIVMRTPQSSALPYAALSIGAAIVIYIVLYLIASILVPGPGFI